MSRLPYPPPYQDIATLSEHRNVGESTIDNWVKLGQFPKPKRLGGKRLWSWKEVRRHIELPSIDEAEADDKAYTDSIVKYPYPPLRATRVYFIRLNDVIKIGVTSDLRERMIDLMNDSPYKIELLRFVRGDRELERSYHLKFGRLRVRGEWFRAEQDLLDFIETLTNDQIAAPAL